MNYKKDEALKELPALCKEREELTSLLRSVKNGSDWYHMAIHSGGEHTMERYRFNWFEKAPGTNITPRDLAMWILRAKLKRVQEKIRRRCALIARVD